MRLGVVHERPAEVGQQRQQHQVLQRRVLPLTHRRGRPPSRLTPLHLRSQQPCASTTFHAYLACPNSWPHWHAVRLSQLKLACSASLAYLHLHSLRCAGSTCSDSKKQELAHVSIRSCFQRGVMHSAGNKPVGASALSMPRMRGTSEGTATSPVAPPPLNCRQPLLLGLASDVPSNIKCQHETSNVAPCFCSLTDITRSSSRPHALWVARMRWSGHECVAVQHMH